LHGLRWHVFRLVSHGSDQNVKTEKLEGRN
jgi:hypothetical protein